MGGTQVAVAKLYKEYVDSAFSHWAGCSVSNLASIVKAGDPAQQLRALRAGALDLAAAQEAAQKVGAGAGCRRSVCRGAACRGAAH